MGASLEPRVQTIEEFLRCNEEKELLRFSTAGSVDDGKSTLIGRLLYDSRGVYEDQLASVRKASTNRNAGALDFSLLTDGLRAEREQNITIDVAYRYFSTPRRKFIIADTPGHEQYTRNMATGASTAHLAIVLIDARKGVLPQSRRHAYIAWLLGIPQVVVAVNKMDLIGFRQDVFEQCRRDFLSFAGQLGDPQPSLHFIPISALEGDNVVTRSARTPWYDGPSLLEHLENVPILDVDPAAAQDFRFPVQLVLRPHRDFRAYAGRIVSGVVRPGDPVMALPSGRTTRVKSIPTWDGELAEACAPMSVALQLEDEIDVSRGDMLVDPSRLPQVSRRFDAKLVWMNDRALQIDRPYWLKHCTQQVKATVQAIHHRVLVETMERMPAAELALNDIGLVTIETVRPLFFDAYSRNRATGAFVLIDPAGNATVAAGMIRPRVSPNPAVAAAQQALRSVEYESARPSPAERFARFGHHPATIWLTARKELAHLLERLLFDRGVLVHTLADESEGPLLPELARILNAAGMIAICSSGPAEPEELLRAQQIVGAERFLNVDPRRLPPNDTEAARHIVRQLEQRGFLGPVDSGADGEGI